MNIKSLLYVICLPAFLAAGNGLAAQTSGQPLQLGTDGAFPKFTRQIGFDIRPGYVTHTHAFFKGKNEQHKIISNSFSAHLKYAFRFGKGSYSGQLYPHAYQGIGLAYNSFFSSQLGNPVSVYVFQGSRIGQLFPRLSLDYEWNFGASFGWRKYNGESNPYASVVGSKINAYINLGFLLNWQLHSQWNLVAGVDMSHYSNGNTNYPNAGVNLIGGRIGIVHTLGDGKAAFEPGTDRQELPVFKPYVNYDLLVYGAARKKGFIKNETPYLVSGSFGIIGLNFNPMYNFKKCFRAGASMDMQYDESANIKDYKVHGASLDDVKFYRPPFRKRFALGLSIRGELVMPVFSLNFGIGRNLVYSGDDTKGFYQILALKASVTRHLFLHVGYQLSRFKEPNNLMLGLGYRFLK